MTSTFATDESTSLSAGARRAFHVLPSMLVSPAALPAAEISGIIRNLATRSASCVRSAHGGNRITFHPVRDVRSLVA